MGSTVSNTVVRPVPGGSTSFPTGGLGGIFGNLGQLFSQVIGPVNQQPSPPVSLPVTPVNPSSSMSPIRRFNAVVDPKLSRTMSRPMFKPSRYDGQINQLLERLIPNSSISRSGIESMLPSTSTREVPVNIPTPPPSFSIQDYLNSSFSKRPTMGTQALVPITLPTGETYNLRSGGDASNFRDFLQSIGRNPQDIENIFKRNELAMARGGRVNYQDGGSSKNPPKFIPMDLESVAFRLFKDNLDNLTYNQKQTIYDYIEQNRNKKAKGGIINLRSKYSDGGKIRSYEEKYLINKGYQDMLKNMSEKEIKQLYDSVMGTFTQSKAMGGIMNLKMGGMPVEMDLRAKGGFVPIGKKERADDVPARLSKNEFVFTANAVRNAGGGDIREGAKRMYNLMHKLEAKR
jgi:hypothetical protein